MNPLKPNLKPIAFHFVPSQKAVAKAAVVVKPQPVFVKPVQAPASTVFQRNLQRILRILMDLSGVGTESSQELLKQLFRQQLITAEELPEITSKQVRQLLKTPSIYNNLPVATKADLDNNPLPRIPRELIEQLEKHIKSIIRCKFVIAGSYLRGAKDSGDIDAVLDTETKTWAQFQAGINANSNILHIQEPFSMGDSKVASYWEYKIPARSKLRKIGLIDSYTENNTVRFKVDCFLASPANWIPTMLYATGSGQFNLRMRMVAKRKGYLLNQNGIYKRGETTPIPIKTEKDIFDLVGIAWRPPEQRKV